MKRRATSPRLIASGLAMLTLLCAPSRALAEVFGSVGDSSVELLGTSNVNSWRFSSESIQGHVVTPVKLAVVEDVFAQLSAGKNPDLAEAKRLGDSEIRWEGRLSLPTASLISGHRRRDRDMQASLKAAAHPNVVCHLTNVASVRVDDTATNRFRIVTSGTLNIAGQTQATEIAFTAERENGGRYRIRGNKDILMSKFGISAPRAMLGLIRARDEVRIAFDLCFAPAEPRVDRAAPADTPLPQKP